MIYTQPKSLDERAKVAGDCIKDLKLTIPCLLDDMSDTAEKAYHGWPDRICVIDVDGKVAYICGRGPGGFDPKTAETALKDVLDNQGKWSGKTYPVKTQPTRPTGGEAKRPVRSR